MNRLAKEQSFLDESERIYIRERSEERPCPS